METVLLDNIEMIINDNELFKTLKIDREHEFASDVLELMEKAKLIAKPKALYTTAYIEDRGEDWLVINGVRFTSKILATNLKDVYKVYPYVATCGQEVFAWAKSISDPIENYFADALCQIFLTKALNAMNKDFRDRIKPGKTASMNPGSLEDWPISEQRQLFTLIGDQNINNIGISLTESFLMLPVKSVSGMRFHTEHDFENCMLCTKEKCPGRRALYNPHAMSNRL